DVAGEVFADRELEEQVVLEAQPTAGPEQHLIVAGARDVEVTQGRGLPLDLHERTQVVDDRQLDAAAERTDVGEGEAGLIGGGRRNECCSCRKQVPQSRGSSVTAPIAVSTEPLPRPRSSLPVGSSRPARSARPGLPGCGATAVQASDSGTSAIFSGSACCSNTGWPATLASTLNWFFGASSRPWSGRPRMR